MSLHGVSGCASDHSLICSPHNESAPTSLGSATARTVTLSAMLFCWLSEASTVIVVAYVPGAVEARERTVTSTGCAEPRATSKVLT